jgi:hypothetical protein
MTRRNAFSVNGPLAIVVIRNLFVVSYLALKLSNPMSVSSNTLASMS